MLLTTTGPSLFQTTHCKRALLAVVAITFTVFLHPANSALSLEHKVKAAYIFKILKFVEWENAPNNSNEHNPINICILGTGEIVEAIQLLDSKQANGRPIHIATEAAPLSREKCHVIFVTAGEKNNLNEILSNSITRKKLTISDIDGFARTGGMIELALINDKIKLIANLPSIDSSNVRVSSKLLDLAILVKNNNETVGEPKP